MIPFHTVLPDVAQKEVRWIHLGPGPGSRPPPDEYAFVEFYCSDLDCDCRRVLFQVWARGQREKVMATITYGWEKESFYRKKMPWDPDGARATVRGALDPLGEHSEYAQDFLGLFRDVVLDEPYRLRLRRHYRDFRQELTRRAAIQQKGLL